ncbi:arylsulfatase A-like enzyme [Catalinimonas alkaloidigena]|nr:arylsulfatase A-like enzyme [Catalinimonas alkaloidigena]
MMKNSTLQNLLFVSLMILQTAGCQTKAKTEEEAQRPNILIILTDQHINDGLSYLGNPNLNTPAMDALAAGGVYFTQSYCTSPVCGPARSSIITGRMPHETGVVWNSTDINPEYPTVGQIFQKAGYNTAWAGKWHLPESYP